MYSVLRKLWASANFLSTDVKLKLAKTLLVPILSYSGLVYGNLDSASRQKVQLCLNNAARYVFQLRKYDHISAYSCQLLNCDISTFYTVMNLVFLHKLINTQCPSYLFDKLNFAQSARTLNLIIPNFNYLVTSRMFFVSAVKLWNALPSSVKSIRNPKLFKLAVVNSF